MSKRYIAAGLLQAALLPVLIGAAHAQSQSPAPAAPASATLAAPAAAPTPPPIMPFNDALLRAATDLFSKAQVDKSKKTTLVIDPLIDGVSGAQSTATRAMQSEIATLIKKDYSHFDLKPFNLTTVAANPVVLVGTFTAVNNAGKADGDRDAFRICLALADLATGKIVAKGTARANPQGIQAIPTTYYKDSPVWAKDPMTEAYVKVCQGTPLGAQVDKIYTSRVHVAAVISEAINQYNDGRFAQSLQLYKLAAATEGGDQMRVFNGLYLANWRLGRKAEAAQAFSKIVDYGLQNEKLNVKLLFRPGTASYVNDARISAPYQMWVQQIAKKAQERNSCIEVVGHTSKTGPEPVNQRLSLIRATTVVDRMVQVAPPLGQRMIANGVGSREALIGTGRDDASDALDRRVEFKTIKCT